MKKYSYIFIIMVLAVFCLLGQEKRFESKESFDDLLTIADQLKAESQYDSATTIYNFIKTRAVIEKDTFHILKANMGIASVFFYLKETAVARDYYRQMISLSKTANDSVHLNKAFYGIGGTYQLDGNLDSALYYYERTLSFFMEEDNKADEALILSNLASLYYQKGDYERAIQTSKKSTELAITLGISHLESSNLRFMGLVHRVTGNYDESQINYFDAYRIADANKLLKEKAEALFGLSKLSEDQGDFPKALKYMRNHSNVLEDMYVQGENDQILNLREKYNTAELELENERQENLALQQRKYKTITLIVSVTLVLTAFIIIYVIDQRRKNTKSLADKNDEINKQQIDELLQKQEIASLQGVLEGQETERRRVAIDLHDRLGGILSMVKLHFSVVTESLSKDDQTHAKFMKASDLLDQATSEVRSISHNLMSGVLTKFGLVPALEDLKDKISSTGKLKVNLYSNDLNEVLSAEQELQLYRIVQELISNILKHSQAKEANIQVTKGEGNVNLLVEDDGMGFDMKEVNNKAGIGLSNLKARVAKLNGNFHIDSGRGAGTTISIDIPINHD
ncbi:tetratricopeptide repeat-containing sensor histidine kinase [Roseivirga echinicomitans]